MEKGDRLDDRYRIEKIIGVGGMSEVYLATDLILDRPVAVKKLQSGIQHDEESLRRFKREALSTAELAHPNIVNIYDVNVEDNPYIIMEYVKGLNLKEYISINYPIDFNKIIHIMSQILNGMNYAHQNNIIHRDIKPQNILINQNDNAQITDFGIAIALSHNSITQTNSLLGSVHYLSPEQARGTMVTKASDIYSLGIVLYEMITGELPFDGESAVSIAVKHIQDPLPSIKSFEPNIPQPFENVVLKATAKDPNQRYKTVMDMLEDLVTSLNSERARETAFIETNNLADATKVIPGASVNNEIKESSQSKTKSVPSPSTPYTENKPRRKRSLFAWIIVILSALIIFVSGYILMGNREATTEEDPSIELPNLEGYSLGQVEGELAELGLSMGEVTEVPSDQYDEDMVIVSDPSAGELLFLNEDVDLTVSSGPQTTQIGYYVGLSYSEAEAELANLGIQVSPEYVYSNDVEPGIVMNQNIEPNSQVIPGSEEVILTVSNGPEGFVIEDMSGFTEDEVNEYAQNNNLNVTFEEESSEDVPAGQVISQEPAPGSTVYSGSNVTITLSSGPEEDSLQLVPRLVEIPYQPVSPSQDEETESSNQDESGEESSSEETDSNEENQDSEEESESDQETIPNNIQIFISDSRNNMDEPYREFEITEDTQIILNFIIEGDEQASFRVVRDDEVIEENNVSAEESEEAEEAEAEEEEE